LPARSRLKRWGGNDPPPWATAWTPKSLRFYDLRHVAASLLIADGLPITVVSAMLGHALTSTTLNNYDHVLPGSDRLTGEAMERLLG
jgi:integrase